MAVVFVVFCHFPKCVLICIKIKGEVGAVNLVKAFQYNIPIRYFFVDLFFFFLSCV